MTLILRLTESNVNTSSSSNLIDSLTYTHVVKVESLENDKKKQPKIPRIEVYWADMNDADLSTSSSLFKISMWLSFSLR